MSFFCDAHQIILRSVFKDELEKYASGDGVTVGIKVCESFRIFHLKGIKKTWIYKIWSLLKTDSSSLEMCFVLLILLWFFKSVDDSLSGAI